MDLHPLVRLSEQSKIARVKEFKMPDLEVRRLGRTEMKPKALGLGCGYLGNPKRPDEEAVTTIRVAIGRGINFIDTSPEYGVSEYRVGLALAGGWRENVYLQTKVRSHPRFLRVFLKRGNNLELGEQLQAASDRVCGFSINSRSTLRH